MPFLKSLHEKIDSLIKQANETSVRLEQIAHSANCAKNSSWYPLNENEIVATLYTGQHIIVDRRDLSVAPSLILHGEWELNTGQFFRSMAKPGDVVFDIGANVGYFGLIAATENADGQIHFFEANPSLAGLIEKTCQINALHKNKSNVINRAVGRKSGDLIKLQKPKNLWGSASCHPSIFSSDCEIEDVYNIELISIDDYCSLREDYRCDLVKIDVEGFEEEVLNGMTKTIEANKNMRILMEYTSGAYSSNFFSFLNRWFPVKQLFVENIGTVNITTEDDLNKQQNYSQERWCTLVLSR